METETTLVAADRAPQEEETSSLSIQAQEDTAAAPTDEDEHVYPTGIRLICILAGVTISYFLLFLDLAVISTASPAITSEFDSLTDLGWYSGAYQLASAALQPLSGKIYRYFPLKVA